MKISDFNTFMFILHIFSETISLLYYLLALNDESMYAILINVSLVSSWNVQQSLGLLVPDSTENNFLLLFVNNLNQTFVLKFEEVIYPRIF